jgi:hypothetical protein
LVHTDPDGRIFRKLFDAVSDFLKRSLGRAAPPGEITIDPAAQALVDEGLLTEEQAMRVSRGATASLTQQGLIEATSDLGGGVVVAGMIVGSELAMQGMSERVFSAVERGPLARALGQLFRRRDKIPGGTAGAIRHELRTGELVGGRSHLIKGAERSRELESILKSEPLSPQDRRVAEAVLDDLRSALRGE